MQTPVTIFWFRRDLRLDDNHGLFKALQLGLPVLPIFIFDPNILHSLPKNDRRVAFIHETLKTIQQALVEVGSSLEVVYDSPLAAFQKLCAQYIVQHVIANHDYEPYAQERDKSIKSYLASQSISFETFKDQVIFEKAEIVKDDTTPYTVFTPYSKKWKAAFTKSLTNPFASSTLFHNFIKTAAKEIIPLSAMNFAEQTSTFPTKSVTNELLQAYSEQRDFPAKNGTSKLGIHLRFGTISIRQLVRKAIETNETFLNELIWREFYQMILWHFPHVVNGAFKPKYNAIKWSENETHFKAWCEGKTGYPIVDAGMRELVATGYMHNRVRMIVASFLTKHLLIDWKKGADFFALHLLDFDLAANNGGWQWAAGCGCDAAPYFRVFNPYLQTIKFDKELHYIKKWVPEFEDLSYPAPIVIHEEARKKCLEVYAKALQGESL
ncbi:MAG: deoxyribodipyrimidine photo-lyase [Bacteroidota bacterium]|jgi:deoxyribodipyrimidine photo-lyase|nr:deoxyribodipyrimidine photo-lyase [Bacteroidota bacterium]